MRCWGVEIPVCSWAVVSQLLSGMCKFNAAGKTKCINHFLINGSWYLVDLPGYGCALYHHFGYHAGVISLLFVQMISWPLPLKTMLTNVNINSPDSIVVIRSLM